MMNWLKKWINREEIAPTLGRWDVFSARQPSLAPVPEDEEIRLDGMVQTALSVKRLGILSARSEIVPANSSARAVRIAEFVRTAFERMEGTVETCLDAAMEAFASGWSVQEMVFSQDRDGIWLDAVRPKSVASLGLALDSFGRVSALTHRGEDSKEVLLPVEKFVVYRYQPESRHPRGKSDLTTVRPHWLAKRELMAAWKLHLQRYASPTVLGRFERSVSGEETQTMFDALRKLSSAGALVFPRDFEVTTVGGDVSASTGYIDAIDFHNREIARAILGQTLTTDEGRRVGSLALGKVHLQVMLLQFASLRKELADRVVTEQLIRPLAELNFGPGDTPRYRFEEMTLGAFRLGEL